MMHWICSVLPLSDKDVTNITTTLLVTPAAVESTQGYVLTTPATPVEPRAEDLSGTGNITLKHAHLDPWDFHDWNKNVFIPVLCAFGLIGNVLNLVILGKRIREGVHTMEKGALLGLMALACSDLLFCLITICGAHLPAAKMIYYQKNFVFYNTLYSNWLQNILIKTSAWFTVILSVGRHFVVCHPITARKYLKCKHTIIAIVACVVTWILLHIPLAYTWKVDDIDCIGQHVYFVTSGKFANNRDFRLGFIYTWFLLGFALPVVVLGYCNTKLIHSLHVSKRLGSLGNRHRGSTQRKNRNSVLANSNGYKIVTRHRTSDVVGEIRSSVAKQRDNRDTNQRRITCTLIAIVICFFVFILPSEIVQFYAEVKRPDYSGVFRIVLNLANLMQVVNFSCNFVVYCAVNAYFRKTVKNCLRCMSNGCLMQLTTEQYKLRNLASLAATSATEV